MPPDHDDFTCEHQLPGIDPPRACVSTFSAQRYDPHPLRPLPAVQVHESPLESTRQNENEPLQIDTLRISPDLLAFPRVSVVLLSRLAHEGQSNIGQHVMWNMPTVAIPGPLYRIKESYVRTVGSMKRKLVNGFVVIRIVVRGTMRYLRAFASHVTAPFIRTARDTREVSVSLDGVTVCVDGQRKSECFSQDST